MGPCRCWGPRQTPPPAASSAYHRYLTSQRRRTHMPACQPAHLLLLFLKSPVTCWASIAPSKITRSHPKPPALHSNKPSPYSRMKYDNSGPPKLSPFVVVQRGMRYRGPSVMLYIRCMNACLLTALHHNNNNSSTSLTRSLGEAATIIREASPGHCYCCTSVASSSHWQHASAASSASPQPVLALCS